MKSSFFSFPLNLILLLIWLGSIIWLWKKHKENVCVKFLLSKWGSLSAIALLLILCLVIGLSGQRNWIASWPSVLLFLYFQTVLLLVILRGWNIRKEGQRRWRFILNHLGVLIAVGAAFWGAPDTQTLRLKTYLNEPVSEAYTLDGQKAWLPYSLTLKDFKLDYYEGGIPSMYEATILIQPSEPTSNPQEVTTAPQEVTLLVNKPFSRTFIEDIYLMSFGSEEVGQYCIIQIVREPWKYGFVLGVILMLMGAFLLFIKGPQKQKKEEVYRG